MVVVKKKRMYRSQYGKAQYTDSCLEQESEDGTVMPLVMQREILGEM